MTVIAELVLRGVSPAQYDEVRAKVGWLHTPPDGGIGHLTWWDGADCHNVDVWEDEAAFAAFGENRLGPAMAAIGLDVQPEVVFHQAHEVLVPRSQAVAPTAGLPDPRALLQRMFDEVVNAGKLEVAEELFADDYVDHGPMGDLDGREAFVQMVATWRAAVPDVHCEISDILVERDTAAWLVHATGTHTGDDLGFPATGKRFETVSANLGRFRDGKAVEHWAEQGMFPMLVQLGVLPAPV